MRDHTNESSRCMDAPVKPCGEVVTIDSGSGGVVTVDIDSGHSGDHHCHGGY